MLTEANGPVSPAETQAVIAELQGLYARAAEHEQTFLAMALAIAAESLADNIETAVEWGDD